MIQTSSTTAITSKKLGRSIKAYVLIVLCTLSVSALADETGTKDSSHYDRLKKAFDNAQTAQESDVLGWISGRCFYKSTSDFPENSLLAGFNDLLDPELNSKHKYALIQRQGRTSGYFDNFIEENTPAIIQKVESIITRSAKPSVQEGGSLIAHVSPNTKYSLRKGTIGLGSDAEYLLLRLGVPDDIADAHRYCYYFKKIREEHPSQ